MRQQNNYPAAEYLSGGGIFIRGGRGWTKKFEKKVFRKNLTVPKISRKPTHSTQHYLNTLPKTYPTLIHRGEHPSLLSDDIAYINT